MDKAHIIAEIRRTAAENGGEPLGWRRFLAITGLKRSDILGVHWPRWSDALREAGFEPNGLNQRIESADLLEGLANLALTLGRLPTASDLIFQSKRDADFPNESTFARLGSKSEIVAALHSHCLAQEKFAAVVRLCDEYAKRRRAEEAPEPVDEEPAYGFVYLAKSGRFYKIGMTNSVGRREYELSIQLPERVSMVHVIRTDDPPGIEAYWHNRFAAKRRNGEWFELDAADVAAFKRRKFM